MDEYKKLSKQEIHEMLQKHLDMRYNKIMCSETLFDLNPFKNDIIIQKNKKEIINGCIRYFLFNKDYEIISSFDDVIIVKKGEKIIPLHIFMVNDFEAVISHRGKTRREDKAIISTLEDLEIKLPKLLKD